MILPQALLLSTYSLLPSCVALNVHSKICLTAYPAPPRSHMHKFTNVSYRHFSHWFQKAEFPGSPWLQPSFIYDSQVEQHICFFIAPKLRRHVLKYIQEFKNLFWTIFRCNDKPLKNNKWFHYCYYEEWVWACALHCVWNVLITQRLSKGKLLNDFYSFSLPTII